MRYLRRTFCVLMIAGLAFVGFDWWITARYGLENRIQAQANGVSALSVIGLDRFFKVGETDNSTLRSRAALAGTPTLTPVAEVSIVSISVNQTGYFQSGKKQAVYAIDGTSDSSLTWQLLDVGSGKVVLEGQSGEVIADSVSEQTVYLIDFSDYGTPGTYKLVIEGIASAPFAIRNDIYRQLKVDALAYFYRNRSGIELKPEYAGKEWARPAGHLSDSNVTCFKGKDADGKQWDGCDYTLDASKGWYDAGDYGKYVVNGGISVWTLLNLYERNPKAFGDNSLKIPENGNSIPDILDEVRWEMEFLLNMQIPEGKPLAGMAFHKMHDLTWSSVPTMPPTIYDNNSDFSKTNSGRYAYEPTTAATLNLAAVAAQCARIWAAIDSAFSARCLKAAEAAWDAADQNPNALAGRVPGSGGGDYGDNNVKDEFFWAAAELFITTGKDQFRDALTQSSYFTTFSGLSKPTAMTWGDTAALGTISLTVVPNNLCQDEINSLRTQIVQTADRYLKFIQESGYRVPIPAAGYVWGSNALVLNNALILALAYDFTQNREYLDGVVHSMDYILGLNALNKSFVAGYGSNPMQHPHHRFWGNDPDAGFPPPPPGTLAGGPNATANDPGANAVNLRAKPIAMRYLDERASFSTNEVAINWNAPLTWVASYLDEQFNK